MHIHFLYSLGNGSNDHIAMATIGTRAGTSSYSLEGQSGCSLPLISYGCFFIVKNREVAFISFKRELYHT